MTIYFIYHCKTDANDNNEWQGQSDNELSEKGLKQIEKLKELDIVFDIIYTSPLKRALKTANALKKENSKIIVSSKITERSFGNLEMKPVNEKDKKNLSDWNLNTDMYQRIELKFCLTIQLFVKSQSL